MAYEQQLFNIPLAGDILDDLATAFREIISKVGQTILFLFDLISIFAFSSVKLNRKHFFVWIFGLSVKRIENVYLLVLVISSIRKTAISQGN